MDLENIPTIQKEELLKLLDSEDVVLLNVLASNSYEMIHIKNSLSAPYDKLENGEFDSIDKNKKLVIYCASYNCGASRKAAALMMGRGFEVLAYEGGIKEWVESGYPTEGRMTPKEYLSSL
ncbi:MAG TPA: rhodanese-like domain-containing protein [Thermoplasmataceae archaeon]|nr:rhodanese-like domain-containing protein [Thermoplasmataceae archaeon]